MNEIEEWIKQELIDFKSLFLERLASTSVDGENY